MSITMRRRAVPVVTGSLRVNLMPAPEVERRAQRVLLRRWALILLSTLGVVVLLILGAYGRQLSASYSLAAEQRRTADLTTEVAKYDDVTKSLSEQEALQKYRYQAAGNDLDWSTVLGRITAALPSGVSLTNYELSPGAVPSDGQPTSAVGLSGTLTAISKNPASQAEAVKNLRKVKGVQGVQAVDAGNLTKDDTTGKFSYLITITLDQSVYSGRFDVKAAK